MKLLGTEVRLTHLSILPRSTSKYNEIILGINMDRKKLHLLINKRVDDMIENGLMELKIDIGVLQMF